MKVQKVLKAQGEFLKVNVDIKDGDILTILDGGITITGKFGEQEVFKVKASSKEGNLNFNQTSINNLIDAYGDETDNWRGKSIKVWVITMNVQGKFTKVVFLTAPDWLMSDDGKFVPSAGAVNREVGEVDVDAIPF